MAAMDIEVVSPVGPSVAPNYGQNHAFGVQTYHSEVDLCHLLQAMSLTSGKFKALATETVDYVPHASQSANEHDASTEELVYHSDASASLNSKYNLSDQVNTNSHPTVAPLSRLPGCHFLQSILASLDPGSPALSPCPYPYPVPNAFQTTNGVYIDTLLHHRSLLSTFPPAHKGCAVTLLEIAKAVEQRAWQADRDSDTEAVIALRQEAHIVAHWA